MYDIIPETDSSRPQHTPEGETPSSAVIGAGTNEITIRQMLAGVKNMDGNDYISTSEILEQNEQRVEISGPAEGSISTGPELARQTQIRPATGQALFTNDSLETSASQGVFDGKTINTQEPVKTGLIDQDMGGFRFSRMRGNRPVQRTEEGGLTWVPPRTRGYTLASKAAVFSLPDLVQNAVFIEPKKTRTKHPC